MSNIKPLNYEILETTDGSPTLLLAESQPMHSLIGALSETLAIYGPVAEKSLAIEEPSLLSLGLGLGYNEIMTAALALKAKQADYTLHSFEALPELLQSFQNWIQEKDSPLNSCYEKILDLMCEHLDTNPALVKQELHKIKFYGPINSTNNTKTFFHGIYYDAFSGTTSPELWTEPHMDDFLKNFSAPTCFFSTYASTGNLKRSLIKNNFKVSTNKGFGKKRESTFAQKGTC